MHCISSSNQGIEEAIHTLLIIDWIDVGNRMRFFTKKFFDFFNKNLSKFDWMELTNGKIFHSIIDLTIDKRLWISIDRWQVWWEEEISLQMANENDERNFYFQLADNYIEKFLVNLPNGLTLISLISGLLSLLLSMNGFYHLSSLFILLSALCQYFDQRFRIISSIHIQLNSLADFLSFGLAPIILVHSIRYCSLLMILAFISFP